MKSCQRICLLKINMHGEQAFTPIRFDKKQELIIVYVKTA